MSILQIARQSMPMSAPPAAPVPSPSPLLAGGRVILAAQTMRLLVRIASAMVLTRLLTPAAYGLQGMALTVYGLLYMVRDFGVLTAAQQPDFTRQRFNAYARIGLVGGLGLALLGAALGWPLGWFFREPQRLPPVLAAMSAAFLFSGAAAPALGLLYRQQRIPTLAAIEVGAMTLASAGAVLAAWAGWGVWALVLMALINEAATCVAAWAICPWRPGAGHRDTRWRTLATFGANLTGFGVTDYYARNLDQIAVGWSTGAATLGIYGRGTQITVLPMQFGIAPFTGWIVASLGRLADRPAAFATFFRQTLNGLLHVSFPAAIPCAVAPEAVVRLLYGQAWLAARTGRALAGVIAGVPAVAVRPGLAAAINRACAPALRLCRPPALCWSRRPASFVSSGVTWRWQPGVRRRRSRRPGSVCCSAAAARPRGWATCCAPPNDRWHCTAVCCCCCCCWRPAWAETGCPGNGGCRLCW